MSRVHLVLCLLAVARALAVLATNHSCKDIQIPVNVSVPRYVFNTTIENDWDVASLTFNLTRRDSATSAVLVSGSTSNPINSTYTIGATLCGNGSTTLVLTHGILESKLYWQPNLSDTEQYSFIDAAVNAGYSVLSYDRIGVGSSSRVDSFWDAQFQVETAVLNSIVAYARETSSSTKVALIGHSYGAYISAESAIAISADAVVLTGFSGTFDYFSPFLAGSGLRIAKFQAPDRWGDLDSGYLTTSDLYAEAYAYYVEPYFEHRVAEWAHTVSSEPFAVGELLSLLQKPVAFENITSSVLLLQGQYDLSACGGDCIGYLNQTLEKFGAARVVRVVDNLPAGHNLNLHTVAPETFNITFQFLRDQGL